MGMFNTILAKLGLPGGSDTASPRMAGVSSTSASATVAEPLSDVDVLAQLEKNAEASAETLNWRTSIVDLLKLLGIDSGLVARKELAVELGCPPELMTESADMNIWLHKKVLHKIAESGGNVPTELLDSPS